MTHIALGPGREFDAVRRMLDLWGARAKGVGDDAAVVDLPPGERLVVSTDTSVEDVHFRREWLTAEEIGYRATMAGLSDIAAMGARPLGVVIALTLPESWRDRVDGLAIGIGAAVNTADTVILGGDLTAGATLSIGVTVLGASRGPVGRHTASAGDAIYVTGVLGGPRDALRAWQVGVEPAAWSRTRFARPVARLAEGQWLAKRGAGAMIDVSDGLASELNHLAAASGVEIAIDVERIPVGPGLTARDAFISGEEYELVVAAAPGLDHDAFARAFGIPLTAIGSVVSSQSTGVRATYRGQRVDLESGHDHFSP